MFLKPIVSIILRDVGCIIERYCAEKEIERVVEKERFVVCNVYMYMCNVNKMFFKD